MSLSRNIPVILNFSFPFWVCVKRLPSPFTNTGLPSVPNTTMFSFALIGVYNSLPLGVISSWAETKVGWPVAFSITDLTLAVPIAIGLAFGFSVKNASSSSDENIFDLPSTMYIFLFLVRFPSLTIKPSDWAFWAPAAVNILVTAGALLSGWPSKFSSLNNVYSFVAPSSARQGNIASPFWVLKDTSESVRYSGLGLSPTLYGERFAVIKAFDKARWSLISDMYNCMAKLFIPCCRCISTESRVFS